MMRPDEDTSLILARLVLEKHIVLEDNGLYFRPTSKKFEFLKKLNDGPYPYYCVYLSDKPARITEAYIAAARSVAERVTDDSMS